MKVTVYEDQKQEQSDYSGCSEPQEAMCPTLQYTNINENFGKATMFVSELLEDKRRKIIAIWLIMKI